MASIPYALAIYAIWNQAPGPILDHQHQLHHHHMAPNIHQHQQLTDCKILTKDKKKPTKTNCNPVYKLISLLRSLITNKSSIQNNEMVYNFLRFFFDCLNKRQNLIKSEIKG